MFLQKNKKDFPVQPIPVENRMKNTGNTIVKAITSRFVFWKYAVWILAGRPFVIWIFMVLSISADKILGSNH
jgi:hypothetical protein